MSLYGVIDGEEIRPGVYRIRDFVEKPKPEQAPSNLVIAGRYLLTPDIFELHSSRRRPARTARSSSRKPSGPWRRPGRCTG